MCCRFSSWSDPLNGQVWVERLENDDMNPTRWTAIAACSSRQSPMNVLLPGI
jgi:hypothetical protein